MSAKIQEAISKVFENRPKYELDETQKGLTARERFDSVLHDLSNQRIDILNMIHLLGLRLEELDRDIAYLESIPAMQRKEKTDSLE